MTLRELLRACREAGVVLALADGRIRFRAPTGALSPELRAALQDRKADLAEVLWRLDGMRPWRPDVPPYVPVAKPGQVGGPGHCHSCGVTFTDAHRFGRCDACWIAFDELVHERRARGEGADFEC